MKVQYVGPRVEISHHGISYKKSKEDKYIYLMVALEILKDIDNNYALKRRYIHPYNTTPLKESELHNVLSYYEKNVEAHVEKEEQRYEEKIKHEIEYVTGLIHLSDIEKEVWIKNIELMRKYRIQRAINKIYYVHCIQNIREIIIHKKIEELSTPLNKHFFHVLNSLRGSLIEGIPSKDATVIEKTDKDNNMMIILNIKQ